MSEDEISAELALGQAGETVEEALFRVASALTSARVYFGHGTDNAWDEAVQLVLSVAELSLASDDRVLSHRLTPGQQARLAELMKRRLDDRIPLPYLLGTAWFAGLEFRCDQRALVPRSPLAEVIRNEFQPWYGGPSADRLLDLCCGGGCIGLAAAFYLPELQVDLLDVDESALELARENVALLALGQRTRVLHSNLFAAVTGEKYDIIISNPPYVDAADLAAMPNEYHHEPEIGLGSGLDGLLLTRQILAQAGRYLRPHGLLLVEVGNSDLALEQAFPSVPFTWLDFEHGGHGVFALTARELQEYAARLGA